MMRIMAEAVGMAKAMDMISVGQAVRSETAQAIITKD